ncbi:MAG: hypothetical protein QMC81_02020 [Thermoanaerobacterales bacterium]|nr:hypothetical protein [Thermoanaerobacterales bacterium]
MRPRRRALRLRLRNNRFPLLPRPDVPRNRGDFMVFQGGENVLHVNPHLRQGSEQFFTLQADVFRYFVDTSLAH